jgi:hypothetical protein
MKLYKLVIAILLLSAGIASAQVGRTGVPFLLIAPGARASGMGEAFIAISDDATAVHWNPAGLGRYPLTGSWIDFKADAKDTIEAVVLAKNNLPENNYRQYDLWSVVNGKLARWNGVKWVSGLKQDLKSGTSLQSLIVRYTGLSEKDAEPYIDRLARANNVLAPESIDSLKDLLTASLPADYLYKDEVQYGFEKIHKSWLELRINIDGFNQIRNDIYTALKDSVKSEDKLDKIAFGFDRARSEKGDRSVWIPFDLSLPDSITCIGSDEDYVYVGTSGGLFRLEPDKLRWSPFGTKTDSLPAQNITAIEKVGRHSMYIGTDKGIFNFTGRDIKPFPSESGAPQGHIGVIAAESDRDVWASSDGELYHYDGFKWRNAFEKQFSIGETLKKTVGKFYGELGAVNTDRILAEVTSANAGMTDSAQAGKVIQLPYRLGFRGTVTALGIDQRGRIWIGTTTGVSLFDGEIFHLFGYKLYEAPKSTDLKEVATQFIPDRNQNKIEKLAVLIKEFNGLESDSIEQGSKVLVYANALGSRIRAITSVSAKKTIVATDQGLVEYDGGKWNRLHASNLEDSRVSNIYSKSNELWIGASDKVSIFAAPRKQFTFMHSNYLVQLASDIYYDYLSFVYPTRDWGTFGMGITFLSLGNQIRTDEVGNALGGFYTYEMALTLSYGSKLMNNLYGGVSLRYINSHLSDAGAGKERGNGIGYSVAIDGGILYDMTRRLTLATTITNIGPNISYIDADQADPLPRKLAFGFNYKLIDSPFNRISVIGEATKLLVDLNHSVSTEIKEIIPHLGLEYWYSNYVGLRGGYIYDKVGYQKYFTLGFSLQYNMFRFDFAYIPPSSEEFNRLGNTLRGSLNVGF